MLRLWEAGGPGSGYSKAECSGDESRRRERLPFEPADRPSIY